MSNWLDFNKFAWIGVGAIWILDHLWKLHRDRNKPPEETGLVLGWPWSRVPEYDRIRVIRELPLERARILALTLLNRHESRLSFTLEEVPSHAISLDLGRIMREFLCEFGSVYNQWSDGIVCRDAISPHPDNSEYLVFGDCEQGQYVVRKGDDRIYCYGNTETLADIGKYEPFPSIYHFLLSFAQDVDWAPG